MPSATQLEVRLAGPGDTPAIAAVLYASFVEFKALYTEGWLRRDGSRRRAVIPLYERSVLRRMEGGLHDLFGTPLFTMEKAV